VKKRSKIRDGVDTIVFMVIITLVSISAVSGLHLVTAERVALNESLFLKKAVMHSVNVDVPDSATDVDAWYSAHVRPVPSREAPEYFEVHFSAGDPNPMYVFRRSGKGLWGTITAVIALRADLSTMEGASFLSHNETPGLGARISENWFTGQLTGKTVPLRLRPEETRSADPSEIDAITGATITSVAVRNMLNDTVKTAARTVHGME